MIAFTLDTNCLIDVDEKRPAAEAVLELVSASREGHANVAVAASSASERQKDGRFLENFDLFRDRMLSLGLGDIEVLPGILRYGIGFWNKGLWADKEMSARESLIYLTMFPTFEVEWSAYATQSGIDPRSCDTSHYMRWRNKILDAQAYWTHEFHGRHVFVTSDAKFKRLNGAPEFPSAKVLTPAEAISCL